LAIGKAEQEEIRRIVVEEINSRLEGVKSEITRLSSLLSRLFNTNGGPPGFLQTAHEENKKKIDAVQDSMKEVIERQDMVDDYIEKQKAVREEREKNDIRLAAELAKKVEDSERRFRRYIAWIGLGISIITLAMGLWSHRKEVSQFLAPSQQSHMELSGSMWHMLGH
jgi:hypothetical protein